MIRKFVNSTSNLLELTPLSLIALVGRFALFLIFWGSVQVKLHAGIIFNAAKFEPGSFPNYYWNVFKPSLSTFELFENVYQVPLLSPYVATYIATFGEFFFSIMLLLGIATRISAVGLLGMTAIIQLFVLPDSWHVHLTWAVMLLYLVRYGGGKFSLDALLKIK